MKGGLRINREHNFLFQSVKKWFNEPEQIAHYTEELEAGLTSAEQHLLNILGKQGSVLDVGCGTGRISLYLAEKGHAVTGIDVSEELIAVAQEKSRSKGLNIQFVKGEGIAVPFEREHFDIVIGFKVLGYIPTKKLRNQFMKELYRVLKPNGVLVMTQNIVPDENMDDSLDEHFNSSPASQFQILERGDYFPLGKGYVHWFTEKDLWNEIGDTDFEMEFFKSDEEFQGTGYIRLIKLKKSSQSGIGS